MNPALTQSVKIIPLGGTPNVHDNMYVYESDNDIFIVDCGMGFPDEGVSGVDLTIPDITYLKDKQSKIRGFVVTHGHEDHIGGFPYIIPQLREGIPIYASKLTAGFIKEKFKEFRIDPRILNVVKDRQPISLGDFEIKMIPVTHSVPDTKHLIIKFNNSILFSLYLDDEQFELLKKQKPLNLIDNFRVQIVSVSIQEVIVEING